MYLYDSEPNFSLEVLNPWFLICSINCGHKWSISTEKDKLLVYIFLIIYEKKIYLYIYVFSSYLTDTFAFKLTLSILICLFPAYNY